MKKRVCLTSITIFLFLFTSSLSAQIGIKGGVGLSDIIFHELEQTPYLSYEINSLIHKKPALAFQLGAYSRFDLGKRFGFQPELLFTLQGLDYSTGYIYDDISYKFNVTYLKVPLYLTYNITQKEKRQSALMLGPYASFKLRAVKKTKVDGVSETVKLNNVKAFDFGLATAYAFDFNLPSGQIGLEFSIAYGLINSLDFIEGHVTGYNDFTKDYTRNVATFLSLSYQFDNRERE